MLHRLNIRVYAGQPGEVVSFATTVENGGQVAVAVDGMTIDPKREFTLSDDVGGQNQLRIGLFGAAGESCVVGIDNVDGAVDGDLLLCQPHDPAPVHFYTFIVASAPTMNALAAARGGR